jgi:hypothetical protein
MFDKFNFMTRKSFLLVTFFGFLTLCGSVYISVKGLCSNAYFCERLHDDSLAATLFPFLPLFLFSLITYRMKEEVFQAWFRFARIALPIALALILIAPSYSYNWMFPYDKGMAAIIWSTAFSLASIGIIITTRMKNK